MPSSDKGATSGSASTLWVDLAASQIGAGLALFGVLFLYVSEVLAGPHGPDPGDTALREVGALLLVTGALSVFWDLRGRRALTAELLDAAHLSADVTNAGIKRIVHDYLDLDWDELFAGANHVDLFFAYARTWRATHASDLRRLVSREGSRLRVVVPDPANADLVTVLAKKFGCSTNDLIKQIEEAEADIRNHQAQAASQVEVRRTAEFPVYTLYRFDDRMAVVLYAQASAGARLEVPAFVCGQGGLLYGFFREQFDALWTHARPPEAAAETEPRDVPSA